MSEQTALDRLSAARLENGKPSAARERLEKLFDEGTFVELDAFVARGGVITGYGEIDGVTVFAFSQDIADRGAAVSREQADKITKLYDLALKTGSPVAGIYDSRGGDVAEGSALLTAYGEILEKSCCLSGVVPQVSLVLGVCAGVTAMTACGADFVIMTKKAELFLTPPGNAKGRKDYGTAEAALKSGAVQFVAQNEAEAIETAKKLFSLLPANNLSTVEAFDSIPPEDTGVLNGVMDRLDDVKKCDLVKAICDSGTFLPVAMDYGTGAHTSLCSIGGFTVGMVCTGGQLDRDGAARIARFVSICDSFQIPVVTLLNSEGIVPSGTDELAGAMRDTARLAHVYAEATTPKVTVITGSAVGSAAIALGSADVRLAWPAAVISPLPVSAAVAFSKGKAITKDHTREMAEAEYRENEASAFTAAQNGYVQQVVAPEDTRSALISLLEMLADKRVSRLPKKHSNIPF